MNYASGLASLFACAAREPRQGDTTWHRHKCGGLVGVETREDENGMLVLVFIDEQGGRVESCQTCGEFLWSGDLR
jgi:hypothetical protein